MTLSGIEPATFQLVAQCPLTFLQLLINSCLLSIYNLEVCNIGITKELSEDDVEASKHAGIFFIYSEVLNILCICWLYVVTIRICCCYIPPMHISFNYQIRSALRKILDHFLQQA